MLNQLQPKMLDLRAGPVISQVEATHKAARVLLFEHFYWLQKDIHDIVYHDKASYPIIP